MKKIKKCFFSSLVLLILVFSFNKVEATGSVNLTSNKSSVYVGDTFTITLNLSGNSAATLTSRITIDTSKVDYISGPSNSNYSNGKVIYTWTDPNGGSSPKIGAIATFTFKAKQVGTTYFSVAGDFFDANEQNINPIFQGKSVEIKQAVIPEPVVEPVVEPSNVQTQNPTQSQSNNSNNKTVVSSNANLKSLQINVEGINPKFSKNNTQYYIVVGENINDIKVNAVPEDEKAKVNISGNSKIVNGLNKIIIKVTAQNGAVKNYTIDVTKTQNIENSNANLENLAIEDLVLEPEFSYDVLEYVGELTKDSMSLNILAVPQIQEAKVEIIGNESLQIGENKIRIIVTAKDGVTVKEYTVTINKNLVNENININNMGNNELESNDKNKIDLIIKVAGSILSISTLVVTVGLLVSNKSRKM